MIHEIDLKCIGSILGITTSHRNELLTNMYFIFSSFAERIRLIPISILWEKFIVKIM